MDRVRFGRALGYGARHAAKTLVAAVDAATAENPPADALTRSVAESAGTQGRGPAEQADTAAERVAAARLAETVVRSAAQARQIKQDVARGGRQAGGAMWRPFVKLSGVLWLEVSGFFFGIFALTALAYLWKLHGSWHGGGAESHRSLMGAAAMFLLFGYFCVSNFVRAKRRERGR